MIFVLVFIKISAQSNFSVYLKKPWKNNNKFLLENLEKYPLIDSGEIYFRIPLNIHIYKFPEVPSYYNYQSLKNIVNRLNNDYYKNTGISFYIQDVKTVNKPRFLKSQFITELPSVIFSNKDKYGIDIYYVNLIETNLVFKKYYSRGVFFYFAQSIVVVANSHSSTLPHELGHFLGLEHPHKNWRAGKMRQESVNRTQKAGIFKNRINCQVRGDLLEDTPAEPDLRHFTDNDCNFKINNKDKWGNDYEPNTNNIMSYTKNLNCRKEFTKMQKSVMLYTISNLKMSNVYKVSPQTQHFEFDAFEPDDNIYQSSILNFDKVQSHTFHCVPAENINKYVENKYDYFKIPQIDDSAVIYFEPINSNFECRISFFDDSYNEISSKIVANSCKFVIDNKYSNKYICIELLEKMTKANIFRYKIYIKH